MAGSGPLVLLVHDYPQFWWAWRAQIPALAAAGYRVAALDLRGFGASDKPPAGYDAPTACDDVAAVIRSLGAERAAIVGQGLGAWFAWSMPSHHPGVTAAVAAIGAPHPGVFHRALWRHPLHWRAQRRLRGLLPHSGAQPEPMSLDRRLRGWSGPDDRWLTAQVLSRYAEAMSIPFAKHAAAEYHRWFHRCRRTPTGVRYLHRLRARIEVPVLHVQGRADPSSLEVLSRESRGQVRGPLRVRDMPGVGHFVTEEAPTALNATLIDWLADAQSAD